jgi:ABC-2 type transport system permease protein
MNTGKIYSFIKKDFLLEASYRFNFILQLAGIVFYILTFYFISKLFGRMNIPFLQSYGGDYFSFVLIGIAFSSYLSIGLNIFSQNLRQEQMMGTLEAMLVSPTRAPFIILASSLWEYISTSIEVLVFLAMGIILKVDFSNANIFAALIITLLTILSLSSIGIFSASFIMVFKRGDPINWLINNISILLGGVYFPVKLLPLWLQNFSHLLPITYSLHGLRLALLQGAHLKDVIPDILALFIFSIILFPLSLLAFQIAVKKAKADGSLNQY